MSKTSELKKLFASKELNITPCCWDALSANLIEQAGFPLAFMSGFGVSASRLGLPDTGQISYGEMVDQVRNITAATSIPLIADGDTGYGGAVNVKRTVKGYAQAGAACVMIEDQLSPKRCGHVGGKQVVDIKEARSRIEAAVDAREEGADILILARTDARETHSLSEAIERACMFHDLGADLTFVEAPATIAELEEVATKTKGPKMVNLLEGGKTPFLSPKELEEMGFSIATYPMTGLMAIVEAQMKALKQMKAGTFPPAPMSFEELKTIVGFDTYGEEEARYK